MLVEDQGEGPNTLISVRAAGDLPAQLDERCFLLVEDFGLGESLIAAGIPSTQVLYGAQGDHDAWQLALDEAGGLRRPKVPQPMQPAARALIVLPTYNEKQNLEAMLQAITEQADVHVLVVDDNSPDGTGALAEQLAAASEQVHLLQRPGKLGLGTAYLDGFRWGLERDYDLLLEMDCDFSHDPHDLPRLLHAAEHADLVLGSRFVRGGSTEGWDLRRRMLSRSANFYTKVFLGRSIQDWTGGFRCYRADLLRKLDFDKVTATGYGFQIQMAWACKRAGGKVIEIPIRFIDRELGQSKMSGGIALEAMALVPSLRLRG